MAHRGKRRAQGRTLIQIVMKEVDPKGEHHFLEILPTPLAPKDGAIREGVLLFSCRHQPSQT